MLPIDVDVIRVTLHVLAATIWVGGQIVLVALMPTLQRKAPEAVVPAARAFAWVSWPAFAVLIITGLWSYPFGLGDELGKPFQTTMGIKLTLVILSGVGVALHTFAKHRVLKAIWGAVGLLCAVGALLFGVPIGNSL